MLEEITKQLMEFNPTAIYLFGSLAKGNSTSSSDIDICIIAETSNKRQFIAELYCAIDSNKPIDFIVYTPDEWEKCVADKTSFAHKICNEGVCLYG